MHSMGATILQQRTEVVRAQNSVEEIKVRYWSVAVIVVTHCGAILRHRRGATSRVFPPVVKPVNDFVKSGSCRSGG